MTRQMTWRPCTGRVTPIGQPTGNPSKCRKQLHRKVEVRVFSDALDVCEGDFLHGRYEGNLQLSVFHPKSRSLNTIICKVQSQRIRDHIISCSARSISSARASVGSRSGATDGPPPPARYVRGLPQEPHTVLFYSFFHTD